MRGAIIALALALTACSSAPPVTRPTPVPTHDPNTVSVSVLLDLSGPRAPSGQPQRNAMQIWLDQAQASTRPGALKLRVKFVDVAGSDAKVLLELRRAVADDHADAVVIGVPVTVDATFEGAVQIAAVPVLLTLPAPEPAATAGGGWTFFLAPTTQLLAKTLTDDIASRTLAPTLLAGDETPPAIAERAAFSAELTRRGLAAPAPLVVTQPDGPQRFRVATAVAKSVVLAGASAPYGDLLRALPTTVGSPRVYLSYLTETSDVANLRDQSGLVTWPGSRNLATLSIASTGGERAVFVRAFTERHGSPSTIAASAFDALSIIEAAAEEAPSELEAARLRLRLETLTFLGVVTRYSFSFNRHAGFAPADLAYLRWNATRSASFLASDPREDGK